MKSFLPGEPIVLIRCCIAVAIFLSLVLSPAVWSSATRLYPRVPVLNLPDLPYPFEALLLFVMCAALVALLFATRLRLYTAVYLGAGILLALFDQMRWQPWFYAFSFMLAAVSTYDFEKESQTQEDAIFNSCRIVLIGTYIWAGIQKLNVMFIEDVIPWSLKPIIPSLSGTPAYCIGIALAAVEIAAGLLLVFKRTRNAGIICAIFLHLAILWSLMHQSWNKVVWPWNLAMMSLVFMLFFKQQDFGLVKLLLPRSLFQAAAMVLFLFMPALNFFGLWDYYLSAALYSGNVPQATIEMSEETFNRLPQSLHQYCQPKEGGIKELDVKTWAFGELGVPPYPEVRVLRSVGSKTAQNILEGAPCTVVITTYPRFFEGTRRITSETYPPAAR
ncbi:MAG TPA: MauE/DoxX family redox-associated membrane protein [Candidatus Obscuribacterales bacterium]